MRKVFVVAALLFSSHLIAQEDSSQQMLHEVIVTANKFPQKQATTGKVVTVIGRDVLEQSAGRTVGEVLNTQAGITIVGAQNNLGTNQDVYLHGAALGKTLILIDGIPAYDPSAISNAFDLNHLTVENIERIEIVKGAQSTLYGSDAMAGVINIITRKGGPKPVSFYSTVSGGSYHTYKGAAGVNGKLTAGSYNLQYSRLQSQGFSTAYDSTGTKDFEKDGFKQNSLSGNFSSRLTKKLLLQVNGQLGQYQTDLDATAFTDEKDYSVTSKNHATGAGLQYTYSKGTLYGRYNLNTSKRDYLDDSAYVGGFAKYSSNSFTGRSHFAELFTNIGLHKNIDLLVGSDYRFHNSDETIFSVSSFGPYKSELSSDSLKMHQYSAYASILLKELNGFFMEAGSRFNQHSRYGSNITYTLNPSYLFTNGTKVFVNVSSGFKAPTLYQLANTEDPELLLPETSTTWEGGVAYNAPTNVFTARAVYFKRAITNGIDYNYATYQYFNYNRQKDEGAEIEAGLKLGKSTFNANYTFVTGETTTVNFQYDPLTWSYKTSGDTTYNNLFRRPRHSVNASIGFAPVEKLLVRASARIVGKRLEPVFMDQPVLLQGYHTIDLYSEYRLHQNIKAFADLKNITNQRYFDVWGYQSRRFNFMAGLSINL